MSQEVLSSDSSQSPIKGGGTKLSWSSLTSQTVCPCNTQAMDFSQLSFILSLLEALFHTSALIRRQKEQRYQALFCVSLSINVIHFRSNKQERLQFHMDRSHNDHCFEANYQPYSNPAHESNLPKDSQQCYNQTISFQCRKHSYPKDTFGQEFNFKNIYSRNILTEKH